MDTSNAILTAKDVYVLLSGIVIGVTPSVVNHWLNSKKTDKEVVQIETQAELNRVTVRSTELRDELATGEGVGKMLTTLIEAGETIQVLQKRVFELEQDQIELVMARQDVKQLKGLLDAHRISYSEKDNPH